MTITPTRLRPDLFVLSGFANGNVLAAANDSEVVLVDAQSARRAPYLDSALRQLGVLAPVKLVIDTHYHTDHIGGNSYWLARGARTLGFSTIRARALRDTTTADFGGWHHTPEPVENLPTLQITADTALVAAGRRLEIIHLPNAHTDGDLAIWIPDENVIHTGDILEVGAPPFIDFGAGGTLDGMIEGATRILSLVNDSTAIVPGHGRVVDRSFLIRYREMLTATRDAARRARANGLTEAAFVDTNPIPNFVELLGGAERTNGFLRMVLRGSTADDGVKKLP